MRFHLAPDNYYRYVEEMKRMRYPTEYMLKCAEVFMDLVNKHGQLWHQYIPSLYDTDALFILSDGITYDDERNALT